MAADPTLADRTNDPNDPRWSLADAFDMGVERCRGNRDDTILMTYNGRTHNISTITVGQLRAAAVRLRKLDAIEEAIGDPDRLLDLADWNHPRVIPDDVRELLRRIGLAVMNGEGVDAAADALGGTE